jgi:uncharacterized protein (DUF608 family)
MKFGQGGMGAANGMSPDGSLIRDNEQAPEVWVGTSFGSAALLLTEEVRVSNRTNMPRKRWGAERPVGHGMALRTG